MFEGFPYSNFHQLNLDWIIKIAKDFLDQYTNIQQTITQGLDDLDTKAQELQALLDAWYDEHSQDIADQLADALEDLNTWYTTHQGYLDQYLTDSITAFGTAADAKAAETIASIPDDYTALSNSVTDLKKSIKSINNGFFKTPFTQITSDCIRYSKVYDPVTKAYLTNATRCAGDYFIMCYGSIVTFDNTKYYANYFIVDDSFEQIYTPNAWDQSGLIAIGPESISNIELSLNYRVIVQFKKADSSNFSVNDYDDLISSTVIKAVNMDYLLYASALGMNKYVLPLNKLLRKGYRVNNDDPNNIIIYPASGRCVGVFWFIPNNTKITFDPTEFNGTYFVLDEKAKAIIYTPNTWFTTGEMIVNSISAISQNVNYAVAIQFRKSDNSSFDDSDYADLISNVTIQIPLNEQKDIQYDLWMFMGQSNMAGRGITSETHPEYAPAVVDGAGYEFRPISDPTKLYPIAEQFGRTENNPNGINDGSMKTGSMVSAFANAYYTHSKTPIIAVSASQGGTTISQWQEGGLLTDAIQRLNDAVSFLNTNGYKIRHKYVLWCQGESDMDNHTSKSDYLAGFASMLASLKTAGIEKLFMVRIGEENVSTIPNPYKDMIDWQTEICKTNPDVVMASTDFASMRERGMMKDLYHYFQDAYNEVGTYSGNNCATYVITGKEPTMYDPEYDDLYYSQKN